MLYTDIKVEKVHDGDTLMLLINVFAKKMYYLGYCRLANVWCPELSSGKDGSDAKVVLESIIKGKKLFAEIKQMDMYGRPLVVLTYERKRPFEVVSVNQQMVDFGYAKKVSTKKQLQQKKEIPEPKKLSVLDAVKIENKALVFTDFQNGE